MRIAVTYESGKVFQHFGHTERFKIYDIEEGKIMGEQVVDTNGSGHGALAGFLADLKVDSLICGGIGGGAQMALAQAGIRLYGGVSGEADEAAWYVSIRTTSLPFEYQEAYHLVIRLLLSDNITYFSKRRNPLFLNLDFFTAPQYTNVVTIGNRSGRLWKGTMQVMAIRQ